MGKFKVFYSWQSDLPRNISQDLIRQELTKACGNIQEQFPKQNFIVDEATRDEPGSPNIPLTIFKKISTSDAFVCDITPIGKSPRGKAVANPNVLIELGYAIAELGWGRIVLAFNENFGSCPGVLPKRCGK